MSYKQKKNNAQRFSTVERVAGRNYLANQDLLRRVINIEKLFWVGHWRVDRRINRLFNNLREKLFYK